VYVRGRKEGSARTCGSAIKRKDAANFCRGRREKKSRRTVRPKTMERKFLFFCRKSFWKKKSKGSQGSIRRGKESSELKGCRAIGDFRRQRLSLNDQLLPAGRGGRFIKGDGTCSQV